MKNVQNNKGLIMNSRYTFSSFVAGPSNIFALNAAKAVTKNLGSIYNPLYLYGGHGLGKTHLLKAIQNEINHSNPKVRVGYFTTESFVNELVCAIKTDCIEEFRKKFRTNYDVLLIDDIHFIAHKEHSQLELLETFNFIYSANRQIVVASAKHPKDLSSFDQSLTSRFEWGLIAGIDSPDFETRIEVLRQKAQQLKLNLPNEVVHFIAQSECLDVRQLEGTVLQLVAQSNLVKKKITVELVRNFLR